MILIINGGSSSLKMALMDMPSETFVAEALAERLGTQDAVLTWHAADQIQNIPLPAANHAKALQKMLGMLFGIVNKAALTAVGHRVVHGGERFIAPTPLNPEVIQEIEQLSPLAPLHNPANILAIRAAMAVLPDILHLAVFDTAFHQSMPPHAYLYAVPYHWYEDYGVRRYGFHGTSHHYIAQQAADLLQKPMHACQLLSAHLGNGCSATAISAGKSVDTSMGMTPLEGLVMGTRSGDVDPSLHDFIAHQSGHSLAEITQILNRESGLLALSGRSNDMRTLLQAAKEGDARANLAVDVFCYRLAKSLAGLAVALTRVDAIVFTGGIGEHATVIRAKTIAHLAFLGVALDEDRNEQHGRDSAGFIQQAKTKTAVLVIPTHEEKMIARYVWAHVNQEDSTS